MRWFAVLTVMVALCSLGHAQFAPIETYAVSSVNTSSCATTIYLKAINGSNIYGPDISPLAVVVQFTAPAILEVKIIDMQNPRWELPETFIPRPTTCVPAKEAALAFTYKQNPFSFAVARVANGEVIFNSATSPQSMFNGLIYEDQYLELSTQLPANYHLYGLGEQVLPLLHNYSANPSSTLWARDQGTPVGTNLYGSHPFYLEMRPPGQAHGVYLMNANGMDVLLNATSLTYRVIGGVLDLFFFAGPDPLSVTQQYHSIIGTPRMPPYWGLGWHQCRWGYPNLATVEAVVANYSAAQIPLETMWTDIDYMDNFLDFTTSPTNYPTANMSAFIDLLHTKNQHYVTGYAAYDQGLEQDVFLHASDGSVYIGRVWPGSTAFPDWLSANASAWWAAQIAAFRAQVPVDGLWIDMNEISNFCNGDCDSALPDKLVKRAKKGLGFDPNNPPYAINNGNSHQSLSTKTVPMDLVHRIPEQAIGNTTVEYNIHSLFGISEQMLTCQALEAQTNKRCFVISRSTHPSSGTHGGHWLGDKSVRGVLNMQMFGIPLVGADICGFAGATTEELCGRWMQLGTLYPFSRNHNSYGEPSQEPYVVAAISQAAILLKYSLLPYYYTHFYLANQEGGAQVWRPVFFVFPNDSNTWAIDQQFMIGDGILATPVLTQNASTVQGYFPPSAVWYDFYNGSRLAVPTNGLVTLACPFGAPLPLHVRGGAVIVSQTPANTTTASRLNPMYLTVALNATGGASGQLYVDDGISLDVHYNSTYLQLTAQCFSSFGYLRLTGNRGYTGLLSVSHITILGFPLQPKSGSLNSLPIPASSITWSAATQTATFSFVTALNTLTSLEWTL